MKPFSVHIELPPEVSRQLHRCQIYLSQAPSNPKILRIAIVPAAERILLVPTGQVDQDKAPKVAWMP